MNIIIYIHIVVSTSETMLVFPTLLDLLFTLLFYCMYIVFDNCILFLLMYTKKSNLKIFIKFSYEIFFKKNIPTNSYILALYYIYMDILIILV